MWVAHENSLEVGDNWCITVTSGNREGVQYFPGLCPIRMGDSLTQWRQGIGTMASRISSRGWKQKCSSEGDISNRSKDGKTGIHRINGISIMDVVKLCINSTLLLMFVTVVLGTFLPASSLPVQFVNLMSAEPLVIAAVFLDLIFLAWDVHTNPGPTSTTCGTVWMYILKYCDKCQCDEFIHFFTHRSDSALSVKC